MSGGIIYSVTRSDVRDAITLLSVLASNDANSLWCEGSGPPAKRPLDGSGVGVCGHSDDWYCAAEALGLSLDSVWLAIAATVRVCNVWINLDIRKEESVEILAARHVEKLISDDGEAECLLREGWLPSDYRLVRRHQADRGKYISLSWEDWAFDGQDYYGNHKRMLSECRR